MSTIHIFSKPLNHYPNTTISLAQKETDALLLVGDACFDWLAFTSLRVAKIYVLKTCIELRAIRTTEAVHLIDDTQWVELIATNNIVNW